MKNLTLESFRGKAFKFHINKGISVFQIKDVILDRVELDFDVNLPTIGMPLQRPLVWTMFQKQQLIISLFKGIFLPNCTLIKVKEQAFDNNSIYEVIDGKQRLTTMVDFCNGLFPIEWNGEKYLFNNLPDALQKELLWYWVKADVGYSYPDDTITDSDKIRWFELINFSGTPQDAEHIKRLKQ